MGKETRHLMKLYEKILAVFKIKSMCLRTLIVVLLSYNYSLAEEDNYQLDMTIGSAEAKVTIIEYSSLTCPHCATFHEEVFPKLKEEYVETGKVNLIFREVYFDGPGLWASLVARCSNPEKFFPLVDLILRRQTDWARAESQIEIVNGLIAIGKQAGLKESDVLECLKDRNRAKKLVEWYQYHAKNDQVESTPTILVNGKKMSDRSFDSLKSEIETYLND